MISILIPSQTMPHPGHSIRAANVVLEQLLRALATSEGITTTFLPVLLGRDAVITDTEKAALEDLKSVGMRVAEPLMLPKAPQQPRSPLARFLNPEIEFLQPIVAHRALANAAVVSEKPDWIMTVWSEPLTALFADAPARKFAYYGNPDPKNLRARTRLAEGENRSGMQKLRHWLAAREMEAAHLATMRSWDVVGNVAALDADYYRHRGHPRALYIQNVWIDRFGWPAVERRRRMADAARGADAPVQIVANLGRLSGTANTYGLIYLGDEVLPELRRAFGSRPFELHVYGSGEPHVLARAAVKQKGIVLRGFVDDIDGEMMEKPVFLCVNNATDYNVGHTRYLHAFTLGCCVVGSSRTGLAMPEIRHRENALLGESAREIAECVLEAANDAGLRWRLGEAGYRTFESKFSAPVVTRRIVEEILD
jgi:glycosyltransferase involved in cell wall biosynthesis